MGVTLTDDSLMPFGKHKGKRMEDVPAEYLIWLYENDKCFGEVKFYIRDNMAVLKKQVNENIRPDDELNS